MRSLLLRLVAGGVASVCLIGAAFVATLDSAPLPRTPAPAPKPAPQPAPPAPKKPKHPCPGPGPCPRSAKAGSPAVGGDKSSWVNGREWDGEEITCDFPLTEYCTNIGSHVDGAGMCVSTSIEMCARYLGLEDFRGFRDWCAKEPGGAYPGKIEDQIRRYCEYKHCVCPPFINWTGADPEPVVRDLDRRRLPFAHTYGWSPRYGHQISHMVFSVKFNGKYAVVVDNNEIGGVSRAEGRIFEWMDLAEHIRRMKYGSDSGWVFAWIVPPLPPAPQPNIQR